MWLAGRVISVWSEGRGFKYGSCAVECNPYTHGTHMCLCQEAV